MFGTSYMEGRIIYQKEYLGNGPVPLGENNGETLLTEDGVLLQFMERNGSKVWLEPGLYSREFRSTKGCLEIRDTAERGPFISMFQGYGAEAAKYIYTGANWQT